MPIPVIAGIPWLAGILGGVFSSIFSFAAQYFTKRLALVAAGIGLMAGVVATFYAAISGLVSGISAVVPVELSDAAGFFLPDNTAACLAAYMSAWSLHYAYQWNIKVLQYKFMF